MYLPNLWINMSDYLNLREGKFPIKIDIGTIIINNSKNLFISRYFLILK